jgi:hypothetical protein
LYDHSAVCLDCGHQHLIPKAEQVTLQPWLDWLHKHDGHQTFILPHRLLPRLADKVALAHNANVKEAFAASAAITITLASLASDANLLIGRESLAISNTANLYLDELVAGKITSGTTPTVDTVIEVHAIGATDDTPTYPDVFAGADAGRTITDARIKERIVAPVALMTVNATSNVAYWFLPTGLARFFGGWLPPGYSLFVTHSTAVALNATGGNHVIKRTPVYATVV